MEIPSCSLAYTAVVWCNPKRDLGRGPLGERFIVDITGGTFEGPRLSGRVLPGGADRQLVRADGVKELDALYEMEERDGTIITVHNRVLIDPRPDGTRYARSVIALRAPDGPHAWLNRRMFVGTLESNALPDRPAVRIHAWLLD